MGLAKNERWYPQACASYNCGKSGDDCSNCPNKSALDAFKTWVKATDAKPVDKIWAPRVWRAAEKPAWREVFMTSREFTDWLEGQGDWCYHYLGTDTIYTLRRPSIPLAKVIFTPDSKIEKIYLAINERKST